MSVPPKERHSNIQNFSNAMKLIINSLQDINDEENDEVTSSDNVSQKLCDSCVDKIVKTCTFRSLARLNDMKLKALAAKKEKIYVDASVKLLLRRHPEMILPSSIVHCNIAPEVMVNKNDVLVWKEFYKKKKKMEKIRRKQVKLAKTAENVSRAESPELKINPSTTLDQTKWASSQYQEYTPERAVRVPKLSPALPKLTIRIDETKHPAYWKSSFSDISCQNSIISPIRQNKTKRNYPLGLNNSSKPKMFKSDMESDDSVDSLVTFKCVTNSLFVCSSCDSIFDNEKTFIKHKRRHMRCNLCRNHFRTLEETEAHIANYCSIKHIINNSPIITLKRCNQQKEIVNQYPSAFGINSTTELKDTTCQMESALLRKKEEATLRPSLIDGSRGNQVMPSSEFDTKNTKSKPSPNIFIISDDEDVLNSTNDESTTTTVENIHQSVDDIRHPLSKEVATNSASNNTSIVEDDVKYKTFNTPTTYCTNIRPEVIITDHNTLNVNLNGGDMSILKNLIRESREIKKDVFIQTETPCNDDILPSNDIDTLFEINNLMEYLNYYKIPINISYSFQYSVKFDFNNSLDFKSKDRTCKNIKAKITSEVPTIKNEISEMNASNATSSAISEESLSHKTPSISTSIWPTAIKEQICSSKVGSTPTTSFQVNSNNSPSTICASTWTPPIIQESPNEIANNRSHALTIDQNSAISNIETLINSISNPTHNNEQLDNTGHLTPPDVSHTFRRSLYSQAQFPHNPNRHISPIPSTNSSSANQKKNYTGQNFFPKTAEHLQKTCKFTKYSPSSVSNQSINNRYTSKNPHEEKLSYIGKMPTVDNNPSALRFSVSPASFVQKSLTTNQPTTLDDESISTFPYSSASAGPTDSTSFSSLTKFTGKVNGDPQPRTNSSMTNQDLYSSFQFPQSPRIPDIHQKNMYCVSNQIPNQLSVTTNNLSYRVPEQNVHIVSDNVYISGNHIANNRSQPSVSVMNKSMATPLAGKSVSYPSPADETGDSLLRLQPLKHMGNLQPHKPLNNLVTQNSATPMLANHSARISTQNENKLYNEMQTSTGNCVPQYVPTIRVKDVSELR